MKETLFLIIWFWGAFPALATDCNVNDLVADVVILMDASGSIGKTNFYKEVNAVKKLANFFVLNIDKLQIGAVTFSSNVRTEFKLNRYARFHDSPDLLKQYTMMAINYIDAHYEAGGTNTAEALKYVMEHSFTKAEGDRPEAPNILIVMTDGASDDKILTLQEADNLHKHGITCIPIGIGNNKTLSLDELKRMATNESYVYMLNNYDALDSFLGTLKNIICNIGITVRTSEAPMTTERPATSKTTRTPHNHVTTSEVPMTTEPLATSKTTRTSYNHVTTQPPAQQATSPGSISIQLQRTQNKQHTTDKQAMVETTTTTPPVPQRSDISCDADTIDTFVPISMLPSGAPLTWRDPSCKVTSNGTHMISSIGHNQCGTTVTITKDTVEFENELTAQISNHSANTLIDFGENSYVIPVKCIYPRTETPMTSYVPLQQHVRFYEKRYGHFDVDITQYDSDKFSSAIQGLGVPRKVALNTEIFVEVKMNDQFNNGLGIHVDKCIATPSPSPSDSTYYNLLTDGCPASQHVQLYNAPANKVRFGVRAFQFTSHNSSIVYIHCQTSMCEVGTPYCVSNCVTAGRRKRDVAPDQKSHLVSTGPFVFVADEQDDPIRMSTIVASVSLFVAVVACVAAVMGWTRKKTHKCTKEDGLL